MKQSNEDNKSWLFSILLGIVLFFAIQAAFWLYQRWGITVFWVWIAFLLSGLIFFLETFMKKIILEAITKPKFTVIEIDFDDKFDNVDTVKLNYYNSEFTRLGFAKVTDFTIDNIVGAIRLYHHSEYDFFAEVGYVTDRPVFCSIIRAYEEKWSLVITNEQSSPSMYAIMSAFLRLPRDVYKSFIEEPEFLLKTFLAWDLEMSKILEVSHLEGKSIEFYFDLNNQRREQQKNSLAKKSITWCLIQMWFYYTHPKSEWLGDYEKIKS